MKKTTLFGFVGLALALLAFFGLRQWTARPQNTVQAASAAAASAASASAAAAPASASADSAAAASAPAAVQATLAPVRTGDGVIAEAVITPQQSAALSFATGTLVQQVLVQEGDAVKAGQVLVVSENITQLQSALAASQQALASAQKNYEHLMANAPLNRANAQLALIDAQQAVDDAQDDTQSKQYQRASQDTIDIARAQLITANQALDDAETAFERVSNRSQDDLQYAAGLTNLAKARQNQQNAQYNLNYVQGLPSPLDIEEVETKLDVAQARLLAAKADWDNVKDGPNDPAMVAAQAQVASAKTALDAAQTALDLAVIRAPFDGAVTSVPVIAGELVTPGEPLVTVANLSGLRAETSDLSEMNISQIQVGQSAEVQVDGLGKAFPAQVLKISQEPGKNNGDVVYKVTLQFNEPPAGLRWGMSATVRFYPSTK
jgi:multidrug efflux pump subunit AcrA (membrane-fusion protein)